MTYRRKDTNLLSQWRTKNAMALNILGIPEEIIADHVRFINAIEEGEDAGTNWHSGWVKSDDFQELYELLGQNFTSRDSYLMSELEKQLSHQ